MNESCGCDDGIGMYVCKSHSTPANDVFHYALHYHSITNVFEGDEGASKEDEHTYNASDE